MGNPVEVWKAAKHGLDVWPDVERYAAAKTPMKQIDPADLERMKWYGFFYRKRDEPGRYMVRVRITANELNADQAREIAYIAYEYGHGIVDITTRANIQVQGLSVEQLPSVRRRLEAVGLTSQQTGHDNIRNVFGHPFSGLLANEVYDTRQLCHAVTAIFLGNRQYSDLPRKFNIAFSGAASHSVHYWTQDLSFLAFRRHDGAVRFHVLLAGTQGQNPHLAWFLPVQLEAEQIVPFTQAVLDFFSLHGPRQDRNAARFRFLVERVGIDGVLDWLKQRLGFELEPCSQPPEPATVHDDFIGWFAQSVPGLWAMGLNAPLGRLGWQQLEGLAVLSRKWGDGQLRTTYEQGIAVINIRQTFKDAAATDAAALGLSVYADALDRNCVACTGAQFCNIAVTETKGHMLRLMEQLRRRSVRLHNIRIHMSGCPSSCAQHFTADIGLKGVRVRRMLGTREGFDVYLGGGLAGQVHLGLPYRLGVDVDQLPHLIEEVVGEYYLRRRPGETFSSYWRDKLLQEQARKVAEAEYRPPVWVCEQCGYRHEAVDPPMFCPQCAGVRRHFARLEEEPHPRKTVPAATDQPPAAPAQLPSPVPRGDGFVAVTTLSQLPEGGVMSLEWGGQAILLCRVGNEVFATEAYCPHEGAPLAQGELQERSIVCPWHQWTFDLCSGCSLVPRGHQLETFPVRVVGEEVQVYLAATGGQEMPRQTAACRPEDTPSLSCRSAAVALALAPCQGAELPLVEVVDEGPLVKTFRFDNSERRLTLDLPGRYVQLAMVLDGRERWRSFTVCSSPTSDWIDLTIKCNPQGEFTPRLFSTAAAGQSWRLRGPLGKFYFDPQGHAEPLVLISAGSGITPMMSIVRYLEAIHMPRPIWFFYGARTEADILFHQECRHWQEARNGFRYVVSLSAPGHTWSEHTGRWSGPDITRLLPDPQQLRYFVCGPAGMIQEITAHLKELGVPEGRIHFEYFQVSAALAGASV